MKFGMTGISALVLLAGCATATPIAPADINPEDAKASLAGKMTADGTIVECRSLELTGTRFPAKICKSEKAWERFDKETAEQAKDSVHDIQRNPCSGKPGACF